MRKLDFPIPTAKGAATPIMSKQDKKELANDRQRRERLKRQLRLLYDDVAREDMPDSLMALINQIGEAPAVGEAAPAPQDTGSQSLEEKEAGPAPN